MKFFRCLAVLFAFLPLGVSAQTCFGDFTSSTSGLYAGFNATVSLNVTSINWSFGDATTQTNTSTYVTHTYAQPGTYQVCVIVYDASMTCADSSCHMVTVTAGGCNADFSWVDSVGYVFFINSSTPGPAGNYYWDFGDGNNSTLYSPSHQYAASGMYQVCLVALDSLMNFCDSTCYTIFTQGPSVGLDESTGGISGLTLAPNPADGPCTLTYTLDRPGDTEIAIYDVSGRLISQQNIENQLAGSQKIQLETENFSPGTYIIRVSLNGQSAKNSRMIISRPR
jgi:hypothetical protein